MPVPCTVLARSLLEQSRVSRPLGGQVGISLVCYLGLGPAVWRYLQNCFRTEDLAFHCLPLALVDAQFAKAAKGTRETDL